MNHVMVAPNLWVRSMRQCAELTAPTPGLTYTEYHCGDSGQVGHGAASSLLPVDSMRGFRQGDALAPERGAQVLMRAAVSFLEAGVFFL